MADKLWSVVLAAGNGRRLSPLTHGTPKQFWSHGDRRSLLDETFERIAPLAPADRTTVVVDCSHRCYVEAAEPWPSDWLLYQPEDRGTAAGVLLALSPVFDSAEDAIVLLTPSDHGVDDPPSFRAGVRDAVAVVESGRVDTVLFGIEPSEPVTDYGWIAAGSRYRWAGHRPLRHVVAFVEKPPADLARHLFATRALWNTMVIVTRATALLGLYQLHCRDWVDVFASYRRLPTCRRQSFLAEQYANLPPADLSRDVLTPAQGLAVYSWGQSIGWSDLGTPDRLQRWLNRTRHDAVRKGLREGPEKSIDQTPRHSAAV